MMMQTGLLDWQIRFEQLDNGGNHIMVRAIVPVATADQLSAKRTTQME